jgi:hypothetical protein
MSGIKIKTEIGDGGRNYYFKYKEPEVEIDNRESLEKWMKILNLSEEKLISSVKAYGKNVRKIRRGLLTENENSEEDKAA